MTVNHRHLAVLSLAAALLGAGSASAEDRAVSLGSGTPRAPAEVSAAKPFSNPLEAPDDSQVRADAAPADLVPGVSRASMEKSDEQARDFGSFGIPYTSTRVALLGGAGVVGPSYLSTTYPYRAVGRLTFTNGSGGTSLCSASLIKRSVMVTAAHCVQAFGSGTTLYRNFQYTPGSWGPSGATAGQIAPYGTWTTRVVVRPASWANGTDIGSGAARDNDLAVFIIAKSGTTFVGNRTGWLSYGWNNYSFVSSSKTGNLAVAATSTLGYPALFDSGRIMQRADGPTYLTTVSSANQLWQGNNFTGGSSGGPWVVNFGATRPVFTGGAGTGSAPVMAVIGVTSWGTSDPNAPKDNYSSQFRQNTRYPNGDYGGYGAGNIGSLLNTLCTAIVPGTSQTWAQQGYCS